MQYNVEQFRNNLEQTVLSGRNPYSTRQSPTTAIGSRKEFIQLKTNVIPKLNFTNVSNIGDQSKLNHMKFPRMSQNTRYDTNMSTDEPVFRPPKQSHFRGVSVHQSLRMRPGFIRSSLNRLSPYSTS